jgi:hypothetical protein
VHHFESSGSILAVSEKMSKNEKVAVPFFFARLCLGRSQSTPSWMLTDDDD